MNRRSLIKLAGIAGVAAMVGGDTRSTAAVETGEHRCNDYCLSAAEAVARANIKETGGWKLELHDWSARRMIVTRCGRAGCEVSMKGAQWAFAPRRLASDEIVSFRNEYGVSHWLLLASNDLRIRGFIYNGRHDGWNLSVERASDL